MLVKGEKIELIKSMGIGILNVGEICEVVDVSEDGVVSFKFGKNGMHLGCMSANEFEKYFKKYEEPKPVPTVTPERIEEIMNHSKLTVTTMFDKCTVVTCKLPNGFVIVESSACVSPENYDEKIGVEICINRIKDKVWELEGYRLQEELYQNNKTGFENECLCTDLDCDDCIGKDECWCR